MEAVTLFFADSVGIDFIHCQCSVVSAFFVVGDGFGFGHRQQLCTYLSVTLFLIVIDGVGFVFVHCS